MNTGRRSSWLVFLALMAALLLLATQRPLALPDEGRYGEIGRWMLQSGDFLAPRLDGLPFFHKPPLLHWLQSGAYAVLGVSAWSARFIPALHAGLMLLGLYLSVRHVEGEAQARRAMLVLGSSLGFLIGGQYVNHDMLVAAWISSAIWCMGAAFMHGERPDTRLALLGFASCAFGVLSKGLIGIVLPGMVILAWLLYTGQIRKMLALPWLRGLAVFAAIALPWFILGQQKYPELFNYLIIGQHFARYTGQTFNNQWPFWFYLVVLPALMFPWGLLFVAWLRPRMFKAAVTHDRRDPAVQWSSLLWIWLGVILLFFSLPKSKIVGYILPVLPPAAALVARTWKDWQASERLKNRLFAGLLAASLLLSVVSTTWPGSTPGASIPAATWPCCWAAPCSRQSASMPSAPTPTTCRSTPACKRRCAWWKTGPRPGARAVTTGGANCLKPATSSRPWPAPCCCPLRCSTPHRPRHGWSHRATLPPPPCRARGKTPTRDRTGRCGWRTRAQRWKAHQRPSRNVWPAASSRASTKDGHTGQPIQRRASTKHSSLVTKPATAVTMKRSRLCCRPVRVPLKLSQRWPTKLTPKATRNPARLATSGGMAWRAASNTSRCTAAALAPTPPNHRPECHQGWLMRPPS